MIFMMMTMMIIIMMTMIIMVMAMMIDQCNSISYSDIYLHPWSRWIPL